MPLRVRVKNFQSIEDAEIHVDGFVVITGANNSGKTALMRAIRGLFTNAAAGPLLRRGTNFLSVEIEFEDGTNILWEKGWEKPDKKGASINRYTINGYTLPDVGRGPPDQVKQLGVRSIEAGSDVVWPQIATQFSGTLFLVNQSGAAVAEALSDVERVGQLTSALKLSEKDRRSTASELKVRRKDLKAHREAATRFHGLDEVSKEVNALDAQEEAVLKLDASYQEAVLFKTRREQALEAHSRYKSFAVEAPDSPEELKAMPREIKTLTSLKTRYDSAWRTSRKYKGFDYENPEAKRALEIKQALKMCQTYQARHARLKKASAAYSAEFPELPADSHKKVTRLKEGLSKIALYRDKVTKARAKITDLEEEASLTEKAHHTAVEAVTKLLGDLGVCPTCNTVHDPKEHA